MSIVVACLVAAAAANAAPVGSAFASRASSAPRADDVSGLPAPTDLFAWGRNNLGQLGNGSTTPRSSPTPIALPDGVQPVQVSLGSSFGLAVGSDGHLYAWGDNSVGQLGDGTTTKQLTPEEIPLPGGIGVTAVSTGDIDSFAIGTDGMIYAWGDRQFGDLGDGSGTSGIVSSPEAIALPGGVSAVAVAAGERHTLAIGSDGQLYGWGYFYGTLGSAGEHVTPQAIGLPGGIQPKEISAGHDFSLVAGADGDLYAWGYDGDGELGDGGSATQTAPERIALPGATRVVSVSAGEDFGVAVDSEHNLYTWGGNSNGQLGDGTTVSRSWPARVGIPGGIGVLAAAAGTNTHVVAVGDDGAAYTWGANSSGELGDGGTTADQTPEKISMPGGLTVTAVAAGFQTSAALASSLPAAPHFTVASPPMSAPPGASLSYRFVAAGYPAPSYSIAAGAPDWLTIDPSTGVVSGAIPAGTTSFSYSVTATNTGGAATIGPFTVTMGTQAPVTGHVFSDAGAGIGSAVVEACGGSLCTHTTTDGSGSFSLQAVAGTEVTLTAYPPSGQSQYADGTAGPISVPADGLGGVDLLMPSFGTLDPSVSVGGVGTDSSGAPVMDIYAPTPFSFSGCANGFGTVSVVDRGEEGSGPYTSKTMIVPESSPGSGQYSRTLPPLYPLHGPAQVSATVSCPPAGGFGGQALAAHLAASARANQLRASLSPSELEEIAEKVYEEGPELLDTIGGLQNKIQLLVSLKSISCEDNKSTVEAALSLAAGPLESAAVEAIMPALIEAEVVAFSWTGPALLAIVPVTAIAANYLAGQLGDKLIEAAVDALFANLGCPPLQPNALIDPSGVVIDQNGDPVEGATATILRSDALTGPFTVVDPSSPGIDPSVNPETTDASGVFHWDVSSGYYKVQATAAGCAAPGDPSQAAASIGPYPVPPPQLGLIVALDCPGAPPPTAPRIDALDQANGPPAGGTSVTITGTGFAPTTGIDFGSAPATNVTWLSPKAVIAVAPAGTGTVDVTAHTAAGTSDITPRDEFSYGTVPVVTGLSAHSGPTGGGDIITVDGTGFGAATSVSFGDVPASSFTVVSDSKLTVTVPSAAAAGTVDVQVATTAGASAVNDDDVYTYTSSVAAPVNQSPPGISGLATEGEKLTVTPGAWTNNPTTVAEQWEQCDATGGACTPIGAATDASFTLRAVDVGHTIRVAETAGNAGGTSAPVASAATGVVQPAGTPPTRPANVTAPAIAGVATSGQTLSASSGSWTGTAPLAFAYQWQRCAASCVPIAGANTNHYLLHAADVGAKIGVVVTATNAAGSVQAPSQAVGPVAAGGPTAAAVRAALRHALSGSGRNWRIGSLLKHGGVTVVFAAPSPGLLRITWALPHSSRIIATATMTISRSSRARVTVRLTWRGLQLLRSARRMKLVAHGSFTPTGGSTTVVSQTLVLRR